MCKSSPVQHPAGSACVSSHSPWLCIDVQDLSQGNGPRGHEEKRCMHHMRSQAGERASLFLCDYNNQELGSGMDPVLSPSDQSASQVFPGFG